MGIINVINWDDASDKYQNQQEKNKTEYTRLINEINTSNPMILDYTDFVYYADALNDCHIRKEPYTSNEIRRMMMESQGICAYDMLHSFEGSDSDDVIDFY